MARPVHCARRIIKSELQPFDLCRVYGAGILTDDVHPWPFFQAESNRLLSSVDWVRIEELLGLCSSSAEGFLRFRENKVIFLYVARLLGLHRAPRLRLLDVGAKSGVFTFFAKAYGHDAWASDVMEVLSARPTREILALLNVPHFALRVEALRALPTSRKRYDVITGFRTRFHSTYPWETGQANQMHWGIKEWSFFLEDLATNHLSRDGRIFFWLNRLHRTEEGPVVPERLASYFRASGGLLYKDLLVYNSTLGLLRRSGRSKGHHAMCTANHMATNVY